MSVLTFHVVRPAPVAVPRGAQGLAELAAWTIAAARRLADVLKRSGASEAPTPADLIAWANRIERTQPGFAADLRAAAVRGSSQS